MPLDFQDVIEQLEKAGIPALQARVLARLLVQADNGDGAWFTKPRWPRSSPPNKFRFDLLTRALIAVYAFQVVLAACLIARL